MCGVPTTMADGKTPLRRDANSIKKIANENRNDFAVVKWGSKSNKGPPRKDADPEWLEQVWFAGNHSDIGGSYLFRPGWALLSLVCSILAYQTPLIIKEMFAGVRVTGRIAEAHEASQQAFRLYEVVDGGAVSASFHSHVSACLASVRFCSGCTEAGWRRRGSFAGSLWPLPSGAFPIPSYCSRWCAGSLIGACCGAKGRPLLPVPNNLNLKAYDAHQRGDRS
jgi:hypothetical protein